MEYYKILNSIKLPSYTTHFPYNNLNKSKIILIKKQLPNVGGVELVEQNSKYIADQNLEQNQSYELGKNQEMSKSSPIEYFHL